MTVRRWVGLLLVVVGILVLVYGGFSYVEESHDVEVGPLELAIQEKERVNLPVWLGVLATAVGLGLLAFGARR